MIYERASGRRLALVRIAVFTTWLVDLATHPLAELSAIPIAWFTAHGPWLLLPAPLMHALWSAPALRGLQLVTALSVGLALVGAPGRRAWAALAALLLTLVTGFLRGFGHADHSQLQLLFVTFALPFLPAWDRLCLRVAPSERPPGDPVYAASFAALSLVFSFPYFLTAVYRLSHEGVAIFLGDSMRHFIARDSLILDDLAFTLGLDLLEQPALGPLLGLGFVAVTAAELVSPWVFLRRLWTSAWLCVIGPFHLLAPLLMHVLFAHNMALLLLLYVWPLSWRVASTPPVRPERRADPAG